MENDQLLSQELGRAIDEITISLRTNQFVHVVEQLRALEIDFISRCDEDPIIIRETKRRIAEAAFLASITKESPFRLCQCFFNKASKLGFSNRYSELSFCIIFARRCLQDRRFSEGIRVLTSFEKEWRRKEKGIVVDYSKGDVKITMELLKELRHAL